MSLERNYDQTLVAALASAEKQVQQAYRPVIQVHKWFARRPGTLFRALLLSHFVDGPLTDVYWESHDLDGVVLDPFMGGGTTLFEANRIGLSVAGYDTNPLSRWIVSRKLEALDVAAYLEAGERIADAVETEVGHLYRTRCDECEEDAAVKFFLWAKTHRCPVCAAETLCLPGPLVAGRGMNRHTHDVLVCGVCRKLHQFLPGENRERCPSCDASYDASKVGATGSCRGCGEGFTVAPTTKARRETPPLHSLIALEYHCASCKRRAGRRGRFFKEPAPWDLARLAEARRLYADIGDSPFWPTDEIEPGDETNRLLRWGYRHWSELHNERQLVGLHLLASQIAEAPPELRPALATTFSDVIRYQNLICRYDVAALKVLDVFSIHGFPVHRIQCEAALIGIPKVGSGAWRHWLAKYAAAKEYCARPFETRRHNGRKERVYTRNERIEAELVTDPTALPTTKRAALVRSTSINDDRLPENSVDAVLTDPPYHDSVAYSELLDYCWSWLRRLVQDNEHVAAHMTTRSDAEATGSKTAGRQLEHYAEALSKVYRSAVLALKPGHPLAFTFHDNDLDTYGAVAVALLDARLIPMRTIACPSEMRGSIHIARSGSSRVDTVFVLRKPPARLPAPRPLAEAIGEQVADLNRAGLHVSAGDRRCLTYGMLAEAAVRSLRDDWRVDASLAERLDVVQTELRRLLAALETGDGAALSDLAAGSQ